jgi:hypothetical protein
MKYIMMFGSIFGWVCIFTFVIGFIAAPFSYFSGEIDSTEFLFSIIAFPLLSLLFYYLFPLRYKKYKVDQLKKSLEKEKLLAQKELDRKAEEKQRALDIKKAKEKKEKKLALLKAKSSEEVWASFNKKKVCIDMHIDLVEEIKGAKYEEKRNITKDKTVLKYKFGRRKNSRGNWAYDMEITFVDNRVTAFRDL